VTKDQAFIIPKKSVFNKIVGDNQLELLFAAFLEKSPDVISYAKNYIAVNFKIDYIKASGEISNYYPDFIVKTSERNIYIVETKGLEDLDVPLKMKRLQQWCIDINSSQSKCVFDYVFVDDEGFKAYHPSSFRDLVRVFTKYK
jgi:type III restriction enzyme